MSRLLTAEEKIARQLAHSQARTRRKEARRAAGLCVQCGKEPATRGQVGEICAQREKQARKQPHRLIAIRATDSRKQKRERAERKVRGVCTGCGLVPPTKGLCCDSCAKAAAEHTKAVCLAAKSRGLCARCFTRNAEIGGSCAECRERKLQARRLSNVRVKAETVLQYGGKCACPPCGETDLRFLTMDHIQNDGNKHRAEIKVAAGNQFYRWLKRNQWPAGFQVLCYSCNCGRHANGGVCPHKDGYRETTIATVLRCHESARVKPKSIM